MEELNSLRALRSKFESYQSEFDKIDAWRKENEKYHSDLARWKEDIMAGQLALSNGTSDLVKRECAHIEAMQQLADEKIAYANKLKADDTALLKKRRELKELEQREKMVDDRAAKAAYDRKCATEDRKIIKAKEEEVKRDLKSISEIASLARQRKEEVAQMLSKAAEIQKTNSSTELRIKEAEAALKRDNDNLKYQKKKQADALAEEKRAWQEKMQKGRMELEEKAQALARDQRKLDDANAARQAERKAKKLRKEAAKLAKTQAKKDRNAKGLMPPPPAAAALHPIANGSARAQTRFDDEDDGGKGRKMLEPAKIVEEEVYDNLDEYHHSN